MLLNTDPSYLPLPEFDKIDNNGLKKEALLQWLQDVSPHIGDKISVFNPVFEKFKHPEYPKWLKICLAYAPKYFWYIPASLSGKYHPEHTKGADGLQMHTLETALNVWEFGGTFGIEQGSLEMDRTMAAAILHDSVKYGPYGFEWDVNWPEEERDKMRKALGMTYSKHEQWPQEYFKPITKVCTKVDMFAWSWESHNEIMRIIRAHMGSMIDGKWGSNGKPPQRPDEQLLHMADYIASRKLHPREILLYNQGGNDGNTGAGHTPGTDESPLPQPEGQEG